jgi:FixJ family two-component response regulator
MQKRKANYVSNSYELMVENGFDIESETSVDDQLFSIEELSMREKEYCRLLLLEYTNAEISKIMGVSLTALSYYRTKIKIKWQKLYN